jgi:sugar diacid utilization regulator
MLTTRRSVYAADGVGVLRSLALAVDRSAIEQVGEAMVEAMAVGMPDGEADAGFRADAVAASRETASGFLLSLVREPWTVPEIPPSLAELARTMARRSYEVTDLIRLTRHGQAVYWPALMTWAEQEIADPYVRMRALTVAYDRFSSYLEVSLAAAVAVYQQERDERARGAQIRRDQTIRSLLSDEDVEVDEASQRLGYELRRFHTAAVIWCPAREPGAQRQLTAAAGAIADALGAQRALTTASSSQALWAWIGTDRLPTARQRRALVELDLPAGLRIAAGQPARDVEGFVRSHEEARSAQQLAVNGSDGPAVTWYRDVELIALLSHDRRGLRALVERELEGLLGADAASAKLRETALAYVRCSCSPTAAARELGSHKNTVRYRIERVEEALGRTLHGQELRLQMALTAVASLGSAVLPETGGRPQRRRSRDWSGEHEGARAALPAGTRNRPGPRLPSLAMPDFRER